MSGLNLLPRSLPIVSLRPMLLHRDVDVESRALVSLNESLSQTEPKELTFFVRTFASCNAVRMGRVGRYVVRVHFGPIEVGID